VYILSFSINEISYERTIRYEQKVYIISDFKCRIFGVDYLL